MENNVDIYNLLSGEINESIRKLTNALEIVNVEKTLILNLLIMIMVQIVIILIFFHNYLD